MTDAQVEVEVNAYGKFDPLVFKDSQNHSLLRVKKQTTFL